MQDVVVLDLFVGIEVEPSLPALLLRPGIPGQRQRLQAAVGELHKILLQWVDPEGVFDFERGEIAVWPIGFDQVFSIPAEKPRMHAVGLESRIGKITEDALVGRVIHRLLMLRCVPLFGFSAMATGADRAPDEHRSQF